MCFVAGLFGITGAAGNLFNASLALSAVTSVAGAAAKNKAARETASYAYQAAEATARSADAAMIRQGRKWVDDLLKSYKILYNVVYAENEKAIKWLQTLGFNFIKYHKEYGQHKKPFVEFSRIV